MLKRSGKVFLIGAGPGDPMLLTLKAVRCIEDADAILLDNLANEEVLKFARPEAEIFKVGKRGGRQSIGQREIENLMVSLANRGLTVARLKGGDPLIFGRVGEEIQALRDHDIEFELIPGVTAASGIAASLQISLTHRDLSHQLLYLTGPHLESPDMVLPSLHNYVGTIVVYMGLRACATVCKRLVDAGLEGDTPAVAVQDGTMPEARYVFSTLAGLSEDVMTAGLCSPVLLIIGKVVSLAGALQSASRLGGTDPGGHGSNSVNNVVAACEGESPSIQSRGK